MKALKNPQRIKQHPFRLMFKLVKFWCKDTRSNHRHGGTWHGWSFGMRYDFHKLYRTHWTWTESLVSVRRNHRITPFHAREVQNIPNIIARGEDISFKHWQQTWNSHWIFLPQEAFYMSVQTLTTVGFGDVYPATQGGRAFAQRGEMEDHWASRKSISCVILWLVGASEHVFFFPGSVAKGSRL